MGRRRNCCRYSHCGRFRFRHERRYPRCRSLASIFDHLLAIHHGSNVSRAPVDGPGKLADRSAPAGLTVEVRFDKQANRAGYRIALSTIHVQKRLSYDEADQIIESDPALYTLHRIAKQLRDARSNRGAITFRRAELKIRVKGDEIQITKINPNSPSRFVVSEMMILANGLAADFASVNSIPVIYRTQEPREALAVEDTLSAALDAGDSTKTAPSIRRDPQRDLISPALDAVDSTAGRLRGSDITLSGTSKAVEALAF